MKTIIASLAATLLFSACAHAQSTHPIQPAATPSAEQQAAIESANWLAGRWIGEGLGGQLEETWSTPASGQMVGHFRLVREGSVVFYEIMLLDVVDGGMRMRVKHFNPDFVGWEERDGWHAFDPVSANAEGLSFDGLTLRRFGEDRLEIRLMIRYADGVREEALTMQRAPL
jgi:hypothetical protein